MLALRTLLHPTDFSPCAARAFHLACALARDHGARLLVLHAGRRPVAPAQRLFPANAELYQERLAERLGRLRADDLALHVEHRVVLGDDPAAAIVAVAGEVPCDLIVMGTHGRTGLARVLRGSVTEEVTRNAPCPVLALRIPLAQAAGRPGTGREPARTASPSPRPAARRRPPLDRSDNAGDDPGPRLAWMKGADRCYPSA
jgi:nucleotide-binding universal stress UspA family protein